MWGKRLSVLTLCATLSLGVLVQSKPAQAGDGLGSGLAIVLGIYGGVAAANATSIAASSVYLGMERPSPVGWQVYSYAVGGLTFGAGLFFGITAAAHGYEDPMAWIVAGVGATTLTMSILAATLNRKKTLPSVTVAPILLRDVEGGLAPGVGLSVMSF